MVDDRNTVADNLEGDGQLSVEEDTLLWYTARTPDCVIAAAVEDGDESLAERWHREGLCGCLRR